MNDKLLFGGVPPYGKSYISEKINEMYMNLVKKSIDATVNIVDEYIKFWSEPSVQEFHYDVSPVEVLKQLRHTLITGEIPNELKNMIEENTINE